MTAIKTAIGNETYDVEFGKALSNRRRLEIIKLLSNEAMNIQQIANNLMLNPAAVRHHIRVLTRSGLIEEVGEKHLRFGRPTTLYKARQKPVSVGYPKRKYDVLAEILVQALIQNLPISRVAKMLRGLGYQYGADTINDLSLHHGLRKWDMFSLKRYLIEEYLAEEGSQPEVVRVNEKEIVFRLHNCLFAEISRNHPEIICNGLDLGIREGILERSLGFSGQVRNKCMGHGDPYCEFVFMAKEPETEIAKVND